MLRKLDTETVFIREVNQMKNIRKSFSVVIAALLVLTLLPMTALAEGVTYTWEDGTPPSTFGDGDIIYVSSAASGQLTIPGTITELVINGRDDSVSGVSIVVDSSGTDDPLTLHLNDLNITALSGSVALTSRRPLIINATDGVALVADDGAFAYGIQANAA